MRRTTQKHKSNGVIRTTAAIKNEKKVALMKWRSTNFQTHYIKSSMCAVTFRCYFFCKKVLLGKSGYFAAASPNLLRPNWKSSPKNFQGRSPINKTTADIEDFFSTFSTFSIKEFKCTCTAHSAKNPISIWPGRPLGEKGSKDTSNVTGKQGSFRLKNGFKLVKKWHIKKYKSRRIWL